MDSLELELVVRVIPSPFIVVTLVVCQDLNLNLFVCDIPGCDLLGASYSGCDSSFKWDKTYNSYWDFLSFLYVSSSSLSELKIGYNINSSKITMKLIHSN